MDSPVQQELTQRWKEIVALGLRHFNIDLTVVQHIYNIKSLRLFGQARKRVRLGKATYSARWNPTVYEADKQAYLQHIVAHEAAHFVEYLAPMSGVRNHNGRFDAAMRLFGGDPNADVFKVVREGGQLYEARQARKLVNTRTAYVYHLASGGTIKMSGTVHKRIQAGKKYHVRATKEPIHNALRYTIE